MSVEQPDSASGVSMGFAFLAAASVYGCLFGVGFALYGQIAQASVLLSGGFAGGAFCLFYLNRVFRQG